MVDFEVEKELEDAFRKRDYETSEGVIDFSSFLSAHSMTIELDNKPCVEEIRNVRNAIVGNSRKRKRVAGFGPQITSGRESFRDLCLRQRSQSRSRNAGCQ
jgi:hypothetical protein